MANEIELKLAIAPEDVARLRCHPLIELYAEGDAEVRTLANRYFDTPDRDLARSRAALRLRRAGDVWLQTLKTAPDGGSGLSSRGEWELPVAGPTLELGAFTDLPDAVRALLDRIGPKLKPVFDTDFEREARVLRLKDGTRLEFAIDRGELRAGAGKRARRDPISEVELELIEGDARRVVDFAARLATDIALIPEPRSKAARGFALADRKPPEAVKATLPDADPDATAAATIATVISGCHEALLINTALIRAGAGDDGIELVHQARVSLRRLRVALRHARGLMPRREAALREPLRELGQLLGRTRDLDVLLDETLPRLAASAGHDESTAPLRHRLAGERATALAELRVELALPAFAQTMIALEGFTLRLAGKKSAAVTRTARRELRAARDGAMETVDGLRGKDAAARHQFRIAIKRLRYALDMFGALFDKDAIQAWRRALSDLQDALGTMNDDAVAITLLDAEPRSAATAALIDAARAAITAAQPKAIELAGKLLALPAPWKRKG